MKLEPSCQTIAREGGSDAFSWSSQEFSGESKGEPLSYQEAITRLRRRASASGFRLSQVPSSPSAIVFRGDGAAGSKDVAIKIFLDSIGKVSCSAATTSFAAIEHAQRIFASSSSLGIVKPICVVPELGAVITEWAEGITVQRRFWRSSPSEAGLIANRAGAWLAQLHRAEPASPRPIDVGRIMIEIKQLIDSSTASNRDTLVSAIALLDAKSKMLIEPPESWSIRHGDFKPSNLLLMEDGRILACDITSTGFNFVLSDVAHFLNHAALHLYLRRHRVGVVERAFCNGYFENTVATNRNALAWMRLAGAVRTFLSRASWSRPWRSAFSGVPLLWLIERLTSDMEREL
jgi:aminoglycoside phosphotransferase (APT) family kinase protein